MNAPPLLNRTFVGKILRESVPLGQHQADIRQACQEADMGFGFIYYGLTRILKPQQILVIGSYRGFSVICFAVALNDNGQGSVHFVDDGRADNFWKRSDAVRRHFAKFGVSKRVAFYPIASDQYFREMSRVHSRRPFIDLLYIDGDHSFEGVRDDYQRGGRLVKPGGYILLHDSFVGGCGFSEWEVADFLSTLNNDLYQMITIECAQGLTLIKKLPWPKPLRSRRRSRDRERILQSQLRFLRKANDDLRRELTDLGAR